MKNSAKVVFSALAIALMVSCSLFSEGDPVEAKEGIIGKWQADTDPARLMTFNQDGTGRYQNNDSGVDQPFKYKFSDADTVTFTFENGQTMEWDVKTTTRYLWVTSEGETDRLHKYE